MKQYHEHLEAILKHGTYKAPAREGMPGSISLFGYQNRYDLSKGFPLLTTKKVNFKHIVTELLWFLRGDTNINYLVDNDCNIWNEDAYNYYLKKLKERNKNTNDSITQLSFSNFIDSVKKRDPIIQKNWFENYNLGDCGKQYGWLWRNWGSFKEEDNGLLGTIKYEKHTDQIEELIKGLKTNPMGRRHIITAWNPATLDDMALNACHAFVQFNCREYYWDAKTLFKYTGRDDIKESKVMDYIINNNLPRYYLDCQLYQRSADMFLGVPYNIASYALLTEIVAKICNMVPGEFIHTFGDSHIYDNHMEQVKEILTRDPEKYQLPKLIISGNVANDLVRYGLDESLKFIVPSNFKLESYQHYPAIKAKLSTGLK